MILHRVIQIFGLFLATVGGVSALRTTNGSPSGSEFIVGGRTVNASSYPYVGILVQSSNDSLSTCTGTLIQAKPVPIILTAAHCGSREDLLVNKVGAVVGVDDLTKKCSDRYQPGCRIFLTIDIIQHPEYTGTDKEVDLTGHDFALWILAPANSSLPMTNKVARVNLDPLVPPVGANSTAVGWGLTNPGGSSVDNTTDATRLQSVSLQVAPPTVCEDEYGLNVTARSTIGCLLGGVHRSTCQGDSGGPHIYNNTVWGVTSFGSSTCDDGSPDVVVRTSGVSSWLLETIEQANEDEIYLAWQTWDQT
ncbi:hypothetical protein HDU93_001603 [Gonapodya sp. JEL0774]|nr:hypothetical protein HDU93_001603 [Gonapodya sp. JEL0774]